jgi:hypothetical protein
MKRWFFPVVLVLLTFSAYIPSLGNGFVSDDIGGIVEVAHTWKFPDVAVTKTVIHAQMLVWFGIYKLAGLAPWAFRLVNILCHALSVLLVYAIVFQLCRPPRVNERTRVEAGRSKLLNFYVSNPLFIAFVVSSLFAVHPMLVEPVVWISGGIYCQYGMLFLTSFWLYITGKERKEGILYFLSSYFIFFSMLLFSEKSFVLVLLFFAYEYVYGDLGKHWKRLMPYVIASIFFILLYALQIPGRIAGVAGVTGSATATFYNPFRQIPISISEYWRLAIWPSDLTIYHSEFDVSTPVMVIRWLCVAISIILLGYSGWKKHPLFFWLSWVFVPLLPVITPLRIAWVVAERYSYLSLIGILVCITSSFVYVIGKINFAGLFGSLKRSCKVTHLFFFIVFLYCGVLFAFFFRTQLRIRDWESQDTLWLATEKTSPSVAFTWNNLGDMYSRHGDYQKAAEMFEKAIALSPGFADPYHNLAETYMDLGRVNEAISYYQKALVLNPNLWQSHLALSRIFVMNKEYQKALFHITKGLSIVPENPEFLKLRALFHPSP